LLHYDLEMIHKRSASNTQVPQHFISRNHDATAAMAHTRGEKKAS